MSIFRPQDLRTHWIAEHGWIVETPVALSRPQLERIRDWVRKIQRDRLIGMAPGDRRDECIRTLSDLEPKSGRFSQRLMTTRDGACAFQSTERVQPSRTFFYNVDVEI